MLALSLLFPIVTGFAYLLYVCYRRLLVTPIPGIPCNEESAYTFMGDFPNLIKAVGKGELMSDWIASLNVRHQTPIAQLFLRPFCKPWIVVTDFRESQDILLRRTKEFDRAPSTKDLFEGITPEFHIHMQNSDELREHKLLLRDLMMPTFLHQVAAPRVHASDLNLVDLWLLKARLAEGHPINAFDDIFDVMLDTITIVTFGLDVSQSTLALRARGLTENPTVKLPDDINEPATFVTTPRPTEYQAIITLIESLGRAVQTPKPRLWHWFIRQTSLYRKAYRIKENLITSELEKGAARAAKGDLTEKSALDNVLQRELTAAKKAGRPANYMSRAMKDELFGFLAGGYDTTASTMTWGFKYLSNSPAVQTRLRNDIRNAFPDAAAEGRAPSAEEIVKSHIPYLEATIEEISRTAHTFAFIIRHTMVDTTILGHRVPKGTDVIMMGVGPCYDAPPMPIPDTQRNDTTLAAKVTIGEWDTSDMKDFKPERWLKTGEKGAQFFDPSLGPNLSFGLGPRGCFGRKLAYQSMRILLVLILWHLELEGVHGELNSFKGVEKFERLPVHCYLRLKAIELN